MTPIPDTGVHLVLLGTRGGLPPGPDRAGISSVLVVDGAAYVIDCGYASAMQYQRAGLKRQALRNIFITHLHADHVADYYNMIMLGAVTGLPYLDVIPERVRAYGPGPAGALPAAFGGKEVPTIGLPQPTPGITELTDHCHQAYAYSHNIFMRDADMRDPRTLIEPHEIAVPANASAVGETAPRVVPFTVMEDDRVKVTATLVPHGPVFPSFAFRFDTDHGSVTFSGDTKRSQNLIDLARGSRVLVHEAISDPAEIGLPAPIRDHMLKSHTLVSEIGSIAHEADVPRTVLSHIGDFTGEVDVEKWTQIARAGYSGEVTVGSDLSSLTLEKGRAN